MIEHSSLSVMFTVDRGVTHELVRHRIASFAQESTRYCNYSNDKFGNECNFIDLEPGLLIDSGIRSLSDTGKVDDINKISMMLEEWRAFFKLRADAPAHPQMREVTIPLLHELQERIPVIFEDIQF